MHLLKDPILIPQARGDRTLAGGCSAQTAPSYWPWGRDATKAAGGTARQRESRNRRSSRSLTFAVGAQGCGQDRRHEAAEAQEPVPSHSLRWGARGARCSRDAGFAPAACCLFSAWILSAVPPESLPTGRARVPWADSPGPRAQPRRYGQAPSHTPARGCPRRREAHRRDLLPAPSLGGGG